MPDNLGAWAHGSHQNVVKHGIPSTRQLYELPMNLLGSETYWVHYDLDLVQWQWLRWPLRLAVGYFVWGSCQHRLHWPCASVCSVESRPGCTDPVSFWMTLHLVVSPVNRSFRPELHMKIINVKKSWIIKSSEYQEQLLLMSSWNNQLKGQLLSHFLLNTCSQLPMCQSRAGRGWDGDRFRILEARWLVAARRRPLHQPSGWPEARTGSCPSSHRSLQQKHFIQN